MLNAVDHPDRVLEDHILAIPTLVKHTPAPMRHLVGNLTDPERVRRRPGPRPRVRSPRNQSLRQEGAHEPTRQRLEGGRARRAPAADRRPPTDPDVRSAAAASMPSWSATSGHEQVYTLTSADRPYRVIVESMGEGAATVSEQRRHPVRQPAARPLPRGRTRQHGRPGPRRPTSAEGHREALASLLSESSTETRRAELLVTGADGTDVPFLAAATDIDLDGVLVRCLVLTDLTTQKLVEQQLAGRGRALPSGSGSPPRSTTPSCRGWWPPRWPSISGRWTTPAS